MVSKTTWCLLTLAKLSCATLGQYFTYNFTLTTTAPVAGLSGQQLYYTETVIGIDLPEVYLASYSEDFQGFNYTVPVNVGLDLTNAAPVSINVTGTGHAPTSQLHIRIPDSGTLPPIGPVTLGATGETHQFDLGKVNFTVYVGSLPTLVVRPAYGL